MYIKNRQNSSKFKAFGSSNFVLNRKFSTSKLPTFHMLNVVSKLKKPPHVKAHLVFPDTKANAQKTKRAFTFPPPPNPK